MYPTLQFTSGVEESNPIPYLNVLAIRNNRKALTNVYSKLVLPFLVNMRNGNADFHSIYEVATK